MTFLPPSRPTNGELFKGADLPTGDGEGWPICQHCDRNAPVKPLRGKNGKGPGSTCGAPECQETRRIIVATAYRSSEAGVAYAEERKRKRREETAKNPQRKPTGIAALLTEQEYIDLKGFRSARYHGIPPTRAQRDAENKYYRIYAKQKRAEMNAKAAETMISVPPPKCITEGCDNPCVHKPGMNGKLIKTIDDYSDKCAKCKSSASGKRYYRNNKQAISERCKKTAEKQMILRHAEAAAINASFVVPICKTDGCNNECCFHPGKSGILIKHESHYMDVCRPCRDNERNEQDKEYRKTPEYCAMRNARQRKKYQDPEYRAKLREYMIAWYEEKKTDPEFMQTLRAKARARGKPFPRGSGGIKAQWERQRCLSSLGANELLDTRPYSEVKEMLQADHLVPVALLTAVGITESKVINHPANLSATGAFENNSKSELPFEFYLVREQESEPVIECGREWYLHVVSILINEKQKIDPEYELTDEREVILGLQGYHRWKNWWRSQRVLTGD